jgi:NADPH:quinone reductase-like Zn-dependent oxidoreductase
LIEVEKQVPGEHEVRVKVHATSVNSWDWDIHNGIPFVNRPGFGLFRPKEKIIGCDMAGIVEKAGSKVKEWKDGDEVLLPSTFVFLKRYWPGSRTVCPLRRPQP